MPCPLPAFHRKHPSLSFAFCRPPDGRRPRVFCFSSFLISFFWGQLVVGAVAGQVTLIGYMSIREGLRQWPFLFPLPALVLYSSSRYVRVPGKNESNPGGRYDICCSNIVAALTAALPQQPMINEENTWYDTYVRFVIGS